MVSFSSLRDSWTPLPWNLSFCDMPCHATMPSCVYVCTYAGLEYDTYNVTTTGQIPALNCQNVFLLTINCFVAKEIPTFQVTEVQRNLEQRLPQWLINCSKLYLMEIHFTKWKKWCQKSPKFTSLRQTFVVSRNHCVTSQNAWAGTLSCVVSGSFSMRNVGYKSVLIYRDCCRLLCTQFASFFHLRKFRKLLTDYFTLSIYYLAQRRPFSWKTQPKKLSSVRCLR